MGALDRPSYREESIGGREKPHKKTPESHRQHIVNSRETLTLP